MSKLRLTANQYQVLRKHLFPGDAKEAVALALCGRLVSEDGTHLLCVHELLLVEHSLCMERRSDRVTWPPEVGRALYQKAAHKNMAILKIHSHPEGFDRFSELDDSSDQSLFRSIHGWCDDGLPHGSAVMLPSGEMFGRLISAEGTFTSLSRIAVVGDILHFYGADGSPAEPETQRRTIQTFGDRTTALLAQLCIGVVGCSGTGSWVIEQLARLGVGRIVLVDPKVVERKNLNRIIGTQKDDATSRRPKVEAIKGHIDSMGTATKVAAYQSTVFDQKIARKVAECDVIFGCMDSVEGRDCLNRIAAIYLVPYFDLGVRLDSDGEGGIKTVCGNVNYLLPDGSSLLSRKCYSPESLRVDWLRRVHPEQFASELEEGYIKGAKVESPAVVSVNGFCSAMAVNEFLARIHPFRNGRTAEERRQQFDLVNSCWMQLPDSPICPILSKLAGRGDMSPFLNIVSDD